MESTSLRRTKELYCLCYVQASHIWSWETERNGNRIIRPVVVRLRTKGPVRKDRCKKRRDHPMYCSEIKIYYLAITMNKVARDHQRGCRRLWNAGHQVRFDYSNSSIKQCRLPLVDSMVLYWFCWRKKASRIEAFFKGSDNYNFPKLREKNWGPRNRDFYTNRL